LSYLPKLGVDQPRLSEPEAGDWRLEIPTLEIGVPTLEVGGWSLKVEGQMLVLETGQEDVAQSAR
jgi:hypothetical protein